MMFARATIVALVCAFATAPAVAGDDDSPFTGFYVGGSAGYETFTSQVDIIGFNFGSFDDQDMSYGGLIGYRAAINSRWIVGVEGFARASGVATNITFAFSVPSNMDPDRSFGGGVMLGRIIGERIMVFGSVGGTITKVKNRALGFVQDNQDMKGWRGSGGIELAITSNIAIRGEAIYTNYGNFEYLLIDPATFIFFPVDMRATSVNFSGALIIGF